MKKIHLYIIRNFLQVFLVTFFVSIFVLVMQFLFHNVDDLVGKGVGIGVMLEFFWYASLSLVPMALPLSILLGSLMSFGNLGERLELLAMKAAGISLFRIMEPLIILMIFISIGSFFFADYILPKTQVDMWTMLFSLREKEPELEIPEGAFYNGIPNHNLYVEKKDKNLLLGVIIYDFSQGFRNTHILLADTATLQMSQDKKYLVLDLHNGETFENLTESHDNFSSSNEKAIPYRRENFGRKQVIIDFDANFNKMSSEFLEGQYVSKNTAQLQHTIDSLQVEEDSITHGFQKKVLAETYFDRTDSVKACLQTERVSAPPPTNASWKALYLNLPPNDQVLVAENAYARSNTVRSDINYAFATIDWKVSEIRKHAIEWHKRFTLSFACMIFLFIGAPLGAIIRKGGMGVPIVLSTVLFIIYYIIDNTGYKMAREGFWNVGTGMWLSAFVLLPLGIFLTVMAATDASIMSGESYKMALKKLVGQASRTLHLARKKPQQAS